MADYEARFSTLGRYAPHIFDDPRRKLRKFIDGLKDNIRKHVAICDPDSFTHALRIAHLAEIENVRFAAEQKSSRKRPWSAPTNCQKYKQAQKVGTFRAPPTPQTLTTCPTYGRQHAGKECWRCSNKCFNCGMVGHRASECRKPSRVPGKDKIVY